MPFDAIVLAGGAATRLGGADKVGLQVGGTALLDRVLLAVAAARRRVVVGPYRPTEQPVIWAREEPPGGGPMAGLAAGLALATAPEVLLLAADLPWIGPAVPVLLDALSTDMDAVALVDADGRLDLLASAWRRPALVHAMHALGPPAGKPMRALTDYARVTPVPDVDGWDADCDTWADVAAARARLAARGHDDTATPRHDDTTTRSRRTGGRDD